jgi:hypothetical protein
MQTPPASNPPPCVIQSWDELVKELFQNSYNETLGRHRSPYVFRGQSADYPLLSSLMRINDDWTALPDLERHLLRNFKKYAHSAVARDNALNLGSEWQWVSIAQHHGLPTRLLDWSYSPFVAMHFATANLDWMNQDGVIWCANTGVIQGWLPPALKRCLADAGTSVFTVEMLEQQCAGFDSLTQAFSPENDFAVFFEPPSLDLRIVNQVALFSFLSRTDTRMDDWLRLKSEQVPAVFRKIVIPASVKWEVRDKLDQANVNERVLFPGLDGLSSWLKRWYLPKDLPQSYMNPEKSQTPSNVRESMQ